MRGARVGTQLLRICRYLENQSLLLGIPRGFVRGVLILVRFEIRVGDPEVDDIEKSREEDHDKEELESDIELQRRKQQISEVCQRRRSSPHEEIDNDLDDRQDEHPRRHLMCPVLHRIRSTVNSGMLQTRPLVGMRRLLEHVQEPDRQNETKRRINEITESIPGTLIFQNVIPSTVFGNDGRNHL